VDLNVKKEQPVIFNILQIRPIVDSNETIVENLVNIAKEETIITAENALGNGVVKNIHDFVYIKPESFDAARTNEIANKVGQINDTFLSENKKLHPCRPRALGLHRSMAWHTGKMASNFCRSPHCGIRTKKLQD